MAAVSQIESHTQYRLALRQTNQRLQQTRPSRPFPVAQPGLLLKVAVKGAFTHAGKVGGFCAAPVMFRSAADLLTQFAQYVRIRFRQTERQHRHGPDFIKDQFIDPLIATAGSIRFRKIECADDQLAQ
ncbi:hypothetical protein D3C85_1567460 [compost metagenome]